MQKTANCYTPRQPVVLTPWTCQQLERMNHARRLLAQCGYRIEKTELYNQRLHGSVLHITPAGSVRSLMDMLEDQHWLDFEGVKYCVGYLCDVGILWRAAK